MAVRANFLPNERFIALRPALQEHLDRISRSITPEIFPGICDEQIFALLKDGFSRVGAHEGSIWILDQAKENLVIAYNVGPHAAQLTGRRLSLREGIVSMVLVGEQSFVENEVYKNEHHSKSVDQQLGLVTYAMIAIPFYFLKECRGVISCVQLIQARTQGEALAPVESNPPGFTVEHLASLQNTAVLIQQLIDFKLLKLTVGWD